MNVRAATCTLTVRVCLQIMVLSHLRVVNQSHPQGLVHVGAMHESFVVTSCLADDVYLDSPLKDGDEVKLCKQLLATKTPSHYSYPPHIAVAYFDQEVPCREHHDNIQN